MNKGIRQRLKGSNPEDAMVIIQDLDPLEISPSDLKSLMLIPENRKRDPLAFLGLEAKWWIEENLATLKKRFNR